MPDFDSVVVGSNPARAAMRYSVNDNIIYSNIKDGGLIPSAAGAYPGFDHNSNPLNYTVMM